MRDIISYEGYECGRLDVDGQIDKPCPSAKFPQLDHYELDAFEDVGEGLSKVLIEKMPSMWWKCEARPKTADAAQFPVEVGYGSTREESIRHFRANYEKVREKYKSRRGASTKNRHRGSGHPLSPATPPDMRVRIGRFSGLRWTVKQRRKSKRGEVGIG